MIITYLYDRSSIGLGLGIYAHNLKKHEAEYMDFYKIEGEEHGAWFDLHKSVHSLQQFEKFVNRYKMKNLAEHIIQPSIYQEMRLTILRYKLERIL